MISASQRRQQILDAMARLDRLQRGYLSKQYFTQQKGGQTIRCHGPYFVLQHAFQGKKVSRRVAPEEVPAVESDLAAWRRFERLAEEFAEVTERMTLESEMDGDGKKNGRRLKKRDWTRRKSS